LEIPRLRHASSTGRSVGEREEEMKENSRGRVVETDTLQKKKEIKNRKTTLRLLELLSEMNMRGEQMLAQRSLILMGERQKEVGQLEIILRGRRRIDRWLPDDGQSEKLRGRVVRQQIELWLAKGHDRNNAQGERGREIDTPTKKSWAAGRSCRIGEGEGDVLEGE